MRKLHKEQALELLRTLYSASNELKEYSDDQFIDLCADIQEFIEGIYTYFVDVFGNEHKFTIQVEKLFEKIYMVAQKQIESQSLSAEVAQFITELEATMPDKIEVVFFCYKASMSDCFESVYFAAKKDPSCDAYFVPIPYFDRNADGTFGEEHLEGEGYYSDEYELTNWQEYDVEARKPDVIFIMNPYDDGNKVTSVHPFFYSKRLKQHTGCLVYIEYGLPIWIYSNPDAMSDVIKKTWGLSPAYVHSDYCITFSKEHAKCMQILIDSYGQLKGMENKMCALGSPKFDKVLKDKKSNHTMPEQWSNTIGNRKVIVYNTSVTSFLNSIAEQKNEGNFIVNECKYILKMQSIIGAYNNHPEVVLWWRPHPLLESVIKSMHPYLYEEYKAIVEEFKSAKDGIYDDTEDLYRAITYSDGMISDESSLLWLYALTGKPFYIPTVYNQLKNPNVIDGPAFVYPLSTRLYNLKEAKGANITNANCGICWMNFSEECRVRNIYFQNFPKRFARYVVDMDKYENSEEFSALQKQMINDFAVNSDGSAGYKIYEFAKGKALYEN